MIKTSRLFLIPSLSLFLLLIPFIGIFLTVIVLAIWFFRNIDAIFTYFKGGKYDKIDDFDKELNEALR